MVTRTGTVVALSNTDDDLDGAVADLGRRSVG